MKQYTYHITVSVGRVEVSGGIDNIAKQVKCEIQAQQKMIVWEDDISLYSSYF